jgi:hypothetical protein
MLGRGHLRGVSEIWCGNVINMLNEIDQTQLVFCCSANLSRCKTLKLTVPDC